MVTKSVNNGCHRAAQDRVEAPEAFMPDIAMPLLGGALIGLSATLLLLAQGRIAGISGLLAGFVRSPLADGAFRLWFLLGLIGTGVVIGLVRPDAVGAPDLGLGGVAIAGLLVGFGTRRANGCTSGHGVVGIASFRKRSFVAVATFMATGAATVLVLRLAGARA